MIKTLPSLLYLSPYRCQSVKTSLFNSFFRSFSASSFSNQKFFTKKHEWITVSGDIATVGISHYAQESLGEIVYVQLPELNSEVRASGECGVVESVKSASELYSPISGVVTSINSTLDENPGLINSDCYGSGWLFKLRMKNQEELNNLLKEEQYIKYLEAENDVNI